MEEFHGYCISCFPCFCLLKVEKNTCHVITLEQQVEHLKTLP